MKYLFRIKRIKRILKILLLKIRHRTKVLRIDKKLSQNIIGSKIVSRIKIYSD
jgi:hypothetical protein